MQTAELLTRPSVAAMDAMLGYAHPVLDHGFIRLIDYMGDEPAVVQAARVSYGKGTKQSSEDRGLLRYLMRHRHTTPLEMAEIKLHCKLPVFVARQWIRHRTANVNEYSARYSILEREFYVPKLEDIQQQSTTNKQGRAEGGLNEADRLYIQSQMQHSADRDFDLYDMLTFDGKAEVPSDDPRDSFDDPIYDVARELARINLPLSTYTEWYWKVDLHNLLHFLSLRADPHAQMEIRAYADVMLKIVRQWVPNIYDAFVDYRLNARSFSGQEMAILRRALASNPGAMAQIERVLSLDTDISKREKDAFVLNLRGNNDG